ncbi:MAG: beta-lactamase family protein [Bacteroidetes bacterium]|nr:beta-lactamase family protein [Bacteroidota bacterium]
MKITHNFYAFLAIMGFLLSACTETPKNPSLALSAPPSPPLDSNLQAFLDDYENYFADSLQLTGTPGAALVVVKDSQVVLLRAFGVKSAGGHDPVDVHTLFRIGSLSKGFAGVLTGILVKNGLLDWTEPVQKYCPDFSLKDHQQAERVEIRHLLSHTTGLPYHAFGNLIEEGFDREAIVSQCFPKEKLFGREGEFFGYQNVAFCIIEPILQAATGKSYQELLRQYIFRPAGMANASCDFETMRLAQNRALPHHPTETGWQPDTVSRHYYDFAAAGGINASITDMGEWLKVLLGQKPAIVTNGTLDEVFRPFVKTGKERRTLPGWIARDSASYAMGWRILEHGTDTLVYHAGFVNNYHSEIALNRRDGIGICILFNANSPMRGACVEAFFRRWEKSLFHRNCCAPPSADTSRAVLSDVRS